MFADVYRGRTVLLTGHTGFKGSWLALWLTELGARVVGFALPPRETPNHYSLLGLGIESVLGDLRDADAVRRAVREARPEIVFHLAAQPLVRYSYREPAETFATNVAGTVHLYEACREAADLRAIVTITTDKVYENREWVWGYRECDPLGAYDPYSSSKACAELVTACYRNSFWNPAEYGGRHQTLLASARAGNVIGGGDWAEDRLVPDLVKGTLRGERAVLRNPGSIRPWQHVLEPLSGYLLLGQKLLEGRTECADAWNFGPEEEGAVAVEAVVRQFAEAWPQVGFENRAEHDAPHEAGLLKLDCSKARSRLGWTPVWTWRQAVERAAGWYRAFYERDAVTTRDDLQKYIADAQRRGGSEARG